MKQKVKLQFSCDLEDVPKFSAVTLEEASNHIYKISAILNNLKMKLSACKIEDLDELKSSIEILEQIRINLVKADNRISDVASVISGLIDFSENPNKGSEEPSEDRDDIVSSR